MSQINYQEIFSVSWHALVPQKQIQISFLTYKVVNGSINPDLSLLACQNHYVIPVCCSLLGLLIFISHTFYSSNKILVPLTKTMSECEVSAVFPRGISIETSLSEASKAKYLRIES